MANKSTDQKLGRYNQGGVTDIHQERLGWWERLDIEASDDDITFIVSPAYSGRPHLVAFDIYGKSSLTWLVLLYNNIVDIEEEFITGKELKLPTPNRVFFDIATRTQDGNFIDS